MEYVNDVDSITLESVDDIQKGDLIRLTIGNKLNFYNVRAIHEWVKKTPNDPVTRIPFTLSQLKKIKKTI